MDPGKAVIRSCDSWAKRFLSMLLFCINGFVLILSLPVSAGTENLKKPTPPTPLYLSHGAKPEVQFVSGPRQGSAKEIALDHVQHQATLAGILETDLETVQITEVPNPGNFTRVIFQQHVQGIPIEGATIVVAVSANGSIIKANGKLLKNVSGRINDLRPTLSARQALAAAVGAPFPAFEGLLNGDQGARQMTLEIQGEGLSLGTVSASLALLPQKSGVIRLVWVLTYGDLNMRDRWRVQVDAIGGEVLKRTSTLLPLLAPERASQFSRSNPDIFRTEAIPQPLANGYTVFPIGVESPNFSSPAAPVDGRNLISDPAGDASPAASPFGWHQTSSEAWTDTQGNNTESAKALVFSSCGASLDCGHALDLSVDPSVGSNVDAALDNVFYWSNILHDVLYNYGFDEINGNFQRENNGNGGVGSDRIKVSVQDPGRFCNAVGENNADGETPDLGLGVCNIASPQRDGALDNPLIIAIHGSTVFSRLTGGPGAGFCGDAFEGVGFGFGDWLGMLFTMEAGDTAVDERTIGSWYFGQGPGGAGFRVFPYTTNMTLNPQTYDSIISKPAQDAGSVWATMLWDVTWALINEGSQTGLDLDWYNGTGGNNLMLQLMLDSAKLQVCDSGFVDARNSILLADQNLTGGANQCVIWRAFARRGLGLSATQGSSENNDDGVEAFDLPGSCSLLPTPASLSVCEGEDAVFTVTVGPEFTPPVTLSASGLPSGSTAIFGTNPVLGPLPEDSLLTISNIGTGTAGNYTVNITGDDTVLNIISPVALTVTAPNVQSPLLLTPADQSFFVDPLATFTWSGQAGNSSRLEIATDSGFTSIIQSAVTTGFSHTLTLPLSGNSLYYWRVTSLACIEVSTGTYSFTTAQILGGTYCSTPNIGIPDNDPVTGVSNQILVSGGGIIGDLNVEIRATHTWVGDVSFDLSSPAGSGPVSMIDRPGVPASTWGCGENDFNVELDDSSITPVENVCTVSPAIGDIASPNGLLSTFNGESADGTWTLRAFDAVSNDTGTLNEWCLTVVLPATNAPPGSIPTTISDRQLLINKGSGSDLDLAWGASCSVGASDFGVMVGTLGDFTSHVSEVCTTTGTTSHTMTPAGGNLYFLIVPLTASEEGGYGQNSAGADRPRAAIPCVATAASQTCP